MILKDQNFTKRYMTDNFAVVDVTSGGNVVSLICNNNQHVFDENDLVDIINYFEADLNKAIFSYEQRPILLSSKENIAFALPSFVASSGMYIIAVPNVSPKAAAFAIQNGFLRDVLVLGELAPFVRASKRIREEAELLKTWIDDLDMYCALRGENDSQDLEGFLRLRISRIAEHIGVNTRIVTVGKIRYTDNLDIGLLLAFVTVMLMIARTRSRNNVVLISIGEDCHGIFISFEFQFEEQDPRYDKEMLVFKRMVDRKRVLFEALEKDGNVSVKMSPIIEDWSLLELKVADNEDIEFELT